jgi:hypothetical protein
LFENGNYLFAEGKILARLRELFPEGSGVAIESLGDVSELIEGTAKYPLVNLTYLGDQPAHPVQGQAGTGASVGRGRAPQAVQQWAVIIGAKDATSPRTSLKAREAAGKMMLTVLEGLQGFCPAPNMPLARASFAGQPAIYYKGGHVFLTAQFNLVVDVVGRGV